MRENRATLEVIAPTVEEAVTKGLADLGLPREAVEIEILDQGSKGLFRLGARQARIRLAVKGSRQNQPDAVTVEQPDVERPATRGEPAAELEAPQVAGAEEDHDLQVARETVTELLDKMKVRARVSAHYGVADEGSTKIPILVDVHGDDLSILIGRRAETLSALQYISGLIVSKELGRPVSLLVDIEGYRSRREGQIRQLARRMAEQAIKTGRRQVLEPMPANERRIIHMELRNHPEVRTESIGEEPRRKVTIIPKES
jgi:spoIIIJ-associated protein